MASQSFEDLVSEAWTVDREGWDFSWMTGRVDVPQPPWDYPGRAAELARGAGALLDVDTGGGEFLAALAPLPRRTVAVESWEPNIPVARTRLGPLGVRVEERIEAAAGGEGGFDVILNRHGRFAASVLAPLLNPGGRVLTQQVGSHNHLELNHALGAPVPQPPESWTLAVAVAQAEAAGLQVRHADEASLPFTFHDIGAVVYQLRMVVWQIPDFDPAAYEEGLRAIDRRIRAEGGFTVQEHRFCLEAAMPTP